MKGWISLYRQIQGHCFYPANEERKFTRLEAWIDLLLNANHTDTDKIVQNTHIVLKRGTLVITQDQLAEKWKWNKRTVAKFLNLLEELKMVSRDKICRKNLKSCTLLKITNYNHFQDNLKDRYTTKCTTEYTTACTPNNNDNNENKYSENSKKLKTVDLLKYARKM